MISRVWHGWTTRANAGAYETELRTSVLPGIWTRNIPGYLGAFLYRRDESDEVQFVTTLLFESLDAVREFAGENYELAVIEPTARRHLTRFDERSTHYEVLRIAERVRLENR